MQENSKVESIVNLYNVLFLKSSMGPTDKDTFFMWLVIRESLSASLFAAFIASVKSMQDCATKSKGLDSIVEFAGY